jgi:hypothetical protein
MPKLWKNTTFSVKKVLTTTIYGGRMILGNAYNKQLTPRQVYE